MATKQGKDPGALIQCENCGEFYSATYRQCPFCDEYDEEYEAGDEGGRRSGGKRLVTNTKGGGYGRGWTPLRIGLTVASIGIIIAAGCIVFSVIKPLVDRGKVPSPVDTPTPPPATQSVVPTLDPVPTPGTENPAVPPQVGEVTTPGPTPSSTPSQIPSTQTANSFTINKSDFTLGRMGETYRIKATFSPSGAVGFVDWSSSDPNVATVASDGTVTGVGRGTATITATMAGGVKHTCIVRCTFSGAPGETPAIATPTPSAGSGGGNSGSPTLNRADFTLSRQGETFRVKVTGSDADVGWASSDSNVASVSSDGTVTAVGKGTCTVTATVDGQKLKCVVRVNF